MSGRCLEPLDKRVQSATKSNKSKQTFLSDSASSAPAPQCSAPLNSPRDHDPPLIQHLFPKCKPRHLISDKSLKTRSTPDWNANSNGKTRRTRPIHNHPVNPGAAVRRSATGLHDNNNGSSTSASSSSASSRLSLASPTTAGRKTFEIGASGGASGAATMELPDPDSGIGGEVVVGGGGQGADTRIEIAGGREIYSQSRSRITRRVAGQRSSVPPATGHNPASTVWEKKSRGPSLTTITSGGAPNRQGQGRGGQSQGHRYGRNNSHRERGAEGRYPAEFDYAAQARNFERGLRFPQEETGRVGGNALPAVHSSGVPPITIKETVFGPEITSFEEPVEDVSPPEPAAGEIVFDDIDDGNWRENESTTHRVPADASSGYDEFDDNDGSDGDPSDPASPDKERPMAALPIADYEGSPKRYGLKIGSGIHMIEVDESGTAKPVESGRSLPGFPQRVNVKPPPLGSGKEPPQLMGNGTSSSGAGRSLNLTGRSLTPESVLGGLGRDGSPDDSVASQHGSGDTASPSEAEMSPPGMDASGRETAAAAAKLKLEDLYEFSETRKVLEDFFKGPGTRSTTLGGLTPETRSLLGLSGVDGEVEPSVGAGREFSDLDYTLRRQVGNSYIGSRLAGDLNVVELSPRKPPRRGGREVVMSMSLAVGGEGAEGGVEGGSPRLISFHEVARRQSSGSPGSQSSRQGELRDVNDNDIDVDTTSTNTETDLGDTEVGLQVGHSRNFTLSPETTDYDSNELESEMSLDYDASLHSSSRIGGTTMPVLEDGLSSGNVSESEDCSGLPSKHPQRTTPSRTAAAAAAAGKFPPSIVTTTNASSSPESNVNPTLLLMKKQITEIEKEIKLRASQQQQQQQQQQSQVNGGCPTIEQPCCDTKAQAQGTTTQVIPLSAGGVRSKLSAATTVTTTMNREGLETHFDSTDPELEALDPMRPTPPPSPAPADSTNHHQGQTTNSNALGGPTANGGSSVTAAAALQDIKEAILRTKQSKMSKPRYDTSPTSPSMLLGTKGDPDRVRDSSHVKQVGHPTITSSAPLNLHQREGSDGGRNAQADDRVSHQRPEHSSPVWVPRRLSMGGTSHLGQDPHHHRLDAGASNPLLRKSSRFEEPPDDDADTDQETDRLLGQNRADDDYGFYDDKEKDGLKKKRSKEVLIEGVLFRARYLGSTQLVCEGQPTKATRMLQAEEAVSRIKGGPSSILNGGEDSAVIVDRTSLTMGSSTITVTVPPYVPRPPEVNTLTNNYCDRDEYLYAEELEPESEDDDCRDSELSGQDSMTMTCNAIPPETAEDGAESKRTSPTYGTAIPGTMFRLRFYGSLEVDEEIGFGKRRRRRPKKTMVEEAVNKVKAPEGETQPSTEVDLFISTEKIMVLNTDLKEIMMDHALRTISYIADIGDLVVLMARRRPVPTDDTPDEPSKIPRPPKMICHVFESDEAQYIAQSIGQAFQVAYMEFLKANGIEDQSFVREMDYQEVLNSQEIFGDELQMFAKKELQKEVVVPKTKGEILGVVIVESGWGSMLPTVVIANLAPAGAAARCGQLNIGDQIIAINGVSLVGLPLSTCQTYIKNTKPQTVVKLTIVPCPPVVEVKIKRPDTKYQLGFSVQNGVICSLLRGGIAERGGVRVGHRIIEINNQSVVAVPHEKIVNLLATSVGEINMKTMPTSMFRLLTGQETPLYI